MMFRSIYNRGCELQTLARLDTALEMVYICDNHSRIQAIDANESARDSGEDGRHSEKLGDVSDRSYMT